MRKEHEPETTRPGHRASVLTRRPTAKPELVTTPPRLNLVHFYLSNCSSICLISFTKEERKAAPHKKKVVRENKTSHAERVEGITHPEGGGEGSTTKEEEKMTPQRMRRHHTTIK